MTGFFSNIKNNKENFFTDSTFAAEKTQATEEKVQSITVPMVAEKQVAATPVKLNSVGNVPLVASVPADENMGLGVEKTTTATAPIKKAGTEAATTKTGESIEERLTRFYGKKYTNGTPEEKQKLLEKYITEYLASPDMKKDIQLKDFTKLMANTKDGKGREMLTEAIHVLKSENQVTAAKKATVEETSPELRRHGEIGLARGIHKCDKRNQRELTHIVVDSKNEEAIQIGASHAAELDAKNQVEAVNIYKTADISEAAKIELGKTLIGQYGDFAKENQVAIHTSMSDQNYWDTKVIEFAASNIYNFDRANQQQAIQITINTNNEAAINCAAAKINYYDKSVQAEAKTVLASTPYESVKETLKTAPPAPTSTSTEAVAQKATTTTTQETFQKANSSEKMKMISAMNTSEKAGYMKEMIKYASNSEKLALLSSSPNISVINLLLDSNPSLEVLSKITSLIGQVQDKDKNALMQKLGNSYSSTILASKAPTLDSNMQKIFLQKMAEKGDLGLVNQDNLSSGAKDVYKDLVKKG
jgi:hypothetical protein